MQILDLLWASEITQGEERAVRGEERKKAVEQVEWEEQELKSALSQEQSALLDKFLTECEQLQDLCERDTFVSGFRLGAKLMLAVLTEKT